MKTDYGKAIGVFICLCGAAVFILALLSGQTTGLTIALIIAALGLIGTGAAYLAQSAERKQDEERFKQMMDKLEIIEKELEKQGKEQSKGHGVAIADVLGAGIKYYTENIARRGKDDKREG